MADLACDGRRYCNCAGAVDEGDTVTTPDGKGVIVTLMEYTADVRMQNWPADATTDVFRYDLTALHLTHPAGASENA